MSGLTICARDKLVKWVLEQRQKGKIIVFTNGCFDLIHAGHVTYLEKARGFGDILIVAVNDDDSVKRLKGPARPLMSLEDRMKLLSALRCVDTVTCFSEDTPLELIKQVNPDVLVKGGDYNSQTVVGAKEVTANGGRLEIVPFVEGKSTSSLLKKIRGGCEA